MTASHPYSDLGGRQNKLSESLNPRFSPLRSISYLRPHVDTSLVMNDEEAHIVASRVSLEQVVMNAFECRMP